MIYRPLYDTENGGPPRAFECLMFKGETAKYTPLLENRNPCGHVTRTERGMKTHLTVVHGFKAQLDIPGTLSSPQTPNAESREQGQGSATPVPHVRKDQ